MAQVDSNTGAVDRESAHMRMLNARREQAMHAFREPERIVISHPDPAHYFQLFITLAVEGENKTRLNWRQRFDTREYLERVKSIVADANEQNLDRLAAELKRVTCGV
jgi:hypothetical protein